MPLVRQNRGVQIPARPTTAIRALLTLAASDVSVSAEHLAQGTRPPGQVSRSDPLGPTPAGLVRASADPRAASSWPETPTRSRSPTSCGRERSNGGVRGMRPKTLEIRR